MFLSSHRFHLAAATQKFTGQVLRTIGQRPTLYQCDVSRTSIISDLRDAFAPTIA
jgi:hypothetical protein